MINAEKAREISERNYDTLYKNFIDTHQKDLNKFERLIIGIAEQGRTSIRRVIPTLLDDYNIEEDEVRFLRDYLQSLGYKVSFPCDYIEVAWYL